MPVSVVVDGANVHYVVLSEDTFVDVMVRRPKPEGVEL